MGIDAEQAYFLSSIHFSPFERDRKILSSTSIRSLHAVWRKSEGRGEGDEEKVMWRSGSSDLAEGWSDKVLCMLRAKIKQSDNRRQSTVQGRRERRGEG